MNTLPKLIGRFVFPCVFSLALNASTSAIAASPAAASAATLSRVHISNFGKIGDEYYRGPHLYCAFADGGMPYEDFVARELGDDYDWPLDHAKKQSDITAA